MKRLLCVIAFISLGLAACDPPPAPASSSGVRKAEVEVKPGSDGLTVEQRNVRDRLNMDNKPGSVKHLYIISPYSGQVIVYSTVRGKVTSSGKRLAPKTIEGIYNESSTYSGFGIKLGDVTAYTNEVLEDDGTYGSSVEYIYWWDAKGNYHQHFFTGGQIIHVSDQPLAVSSVTINMETVGQKPK